MSHSFKYEDVTHLNLHSIGTSRAEYISLLY